VCCEEDNRKMDLSMYRFIVLFVKLLLVICCICHALCFTWSFACWMLKVHLCCDIDGLAVLKNEILQFFLKKLANGEFLAISENSPETFAISEVLLASLRNFANSETLWNSQKYFAISETCSGHSTCFLFKLTRCHAISLEKLCNLIQIKKNYQSWITHGAP